MHRTELNDYYRRVIYERQKIIIRIILSESKRRLALQVCPLIQGLVCKQNCLLYSTRLLYIRWVATDWQSDTVTYKIICTQLWYIFVIQVHQCIMALWQCFVTFIKMTSCSPLRDINLYHWHWHPSVSFFIKSLFMIRSNLWVTYTPKSSKASGSSLDFY